jgi:hypothetical protein
VVSNFTIVLCLSHPVLFLAVVLKSKLLTQNQWLGMGNRFRASAVLFVLPLCPLAPSFPIAHPTSTIDLQVSHFKFTPFYHINTLSYIMADTHLTIPGQWDDAEPSDSRSIKSAVSSTETVTPIQQPASDQSFNLPPALSSQPQGRKTTSPHPANASSDVSSIKWKCPECEHRSPMNPNPCETCRLKWRRDAPLDPEASKHRDLMVVPQDHGSSIDFFTTISNHKARKAAREAANSRVEQSSTEQQIKGKGKGNAPSGVSDADSQMDDGDDAEPKTWEEKGKWVPGRASDPNVARSSNTPVALHGSDNSNESDIPDVAVNLRTNWRGSEDQEVDLAYLDGVSRLFGRDSVDVANGKSITQYLLRSFVRID